MLVNWSDVQERLGCNYVTLYCVFVSRLEVVVGVIALERSRCGKIGRAHV